MRLPQPVPELPVTDIKAASKSYAHQMGFIVDWAYEDSLAGISRDDARVFLRRRTPEEAKDGYAVLIWLNMAAPAEVDHLYAEWKERGWLILEELRPTPYTLAQSTSH